MKKNPATGLTAQGRLETGTLCTIMAEQETWKRGMNSDRPMYGFWTCSDNSGGVAVLKEKK